MIALLLDQGLRRRVAEDLRAMGWDAVHTEDVGLACAMDEDILRVAAEQGRVVVTLDSDFSMLLALSDATAPSVIHLRCRQPERAALVALLVEIADRVRDDLHAGSIISVDDERLRVRRLPIRRA